MFDSCIQYGDVDEDEDDDNAHPLVPLGAINSSSSSQTVTWPQFHKSNSRLKYLHCAGNFVRTFLPMLGARVVETNRGCSNRDYICHEIRESVSITLGPWTFEARRFSEPFAGGKNRSYFAIRESRVHQLADRDYEEEKVDIPEDVEDELLIGQFHRFLHLSTPRWNLTQHSIGQCTLWRPFGRSNTGFPIIDRGDPIVLDRLEKDGLDERPMQYTKVQFVNLQHVETAVAIAPIITGWAKRPLPARGVLNNLPQLSTIKRFLAMPLQI